MRLIYGGLDLTDHPYSTLFGSDFGAPQNVTETLALLLQDGEVELTDRTSNRTIEFSVLVEGADLAECADNERALILEADKAMNTLTLDPEDYGPPTVYETFRAQVALARDDDGEMARLRVYTVTLRASPFGRSADETVALSLPAVGSTTTSLDAGSSATGWSGTNDGVTATVSASGGSVSITASAATTVTQRLSKTFAATTTSTKLLVIDWQSTATGGSDWALTPTAPLAVYGDGVLLPPIAEVPSPTSGYVRSYFLVAAASLATVVVERDTSVSLGAGGTAPNIKLAIDSVAVTNVSPSSGTNRQQARMLLVGGSARAPGTLSVQSETAALGDVLLYTFPADESSNGYSPALRQFRTSGGTVTTDTALVSGASEPISSTVFTIPMALMPRGSFLFMVRVKGSAAGTCSFNITRKTEVGGVTVKQDIGNTGDFSLTTSYQNLAIAKMILPTADVERGSSASVSIVLQATFGAETVILDEAWLFCTSIGSLTQVACGTGSGSIGGSSRRLFLDSPSVLNPRPRLMIGHSADRTDAMAPTAISSWQSAVMEPPVMNALLVTSNATDAVLSARYFKHWHTSAAE